jgi:transcriptional regulator with XRE-family HTH domain
MSFGEMIQKLREQAGLSQSELALKAGVPVRSVQNWEQGHRQPRPMALLPLANALGVSVESLIKSMGAAAEPAPNRATGKDSKKRKGE